MNDKEILEEVYQQMTRSDLTHLDKKDFTKFIEQEWQKRDDQELVYQYNRNREPKDHAIDVAEVERHRGLVIGEDGTVKKIL